MLALDQLRGVAITGMILVANIGDWAHTYAPLVHADWNGWTAADVVFPMFLFGVGMALGLSFPRDLSTSSLRRAFWTRVLRRVVLLILLGLLLNTTYNLAVALGEPPVGLDDIPALRFPGVLQRIGFCYGLTAALLVATGSQNGLRRTVLRPSAIGLVIAVLLLGYWALLRFVPVPGFGAGHLDKTGNLPAYLDRMLFGSRHLFPMASLSWRGLAVYDAEGLLASFPATTNVLFGVLAAQVWRKRGVSVIGHYIFYGVVLATAGLLFDPIMPINKKLWTVSFALLTSGISFLVLALLEGTTRVSFLQRAFMPFQTLGGNAILAYILSILLNAFAGVPLSHAKDSQTLQGWYFGLAKAFVPNLYVASLACSLAIIALIYLVLAPLHRRALHFRL